MTSSRRDRLIDTAIALFNRDGYHATGIDKILAESGVAKMTLYKHFKSKEELIATALRQRGQRRLAWLETTVERRATAPRGRLLAVFETLGEWFTSADFNGCLFAKASAEFPDPKNPIHAAAAEHHRETLRFLKKLAGEAGAPRPAPLARQLMLLIQGATVVTQVNGPVAAADQAHKAAEILIHAALAPAAPAVSEPATSHTLTRIMAEVN